MRAFHLTSDKYAISAIRDRRLKVATINELNDPFELLCPNLTEKATRRKFLEFKRRHARSFGLLSFSKSWRNPLLWSHYAGKHRGAALAFEIDSETVEEVRYSAVRPVLSINQIMESGGFLEEQAAQISSTKSTHWAYEEEIRVAVRLADCIKDGDLYFEPFSDKLRLAGVILGALSEVTVDTVRRSLPRGRELWVERARLAFGSFDVVRNKSVSRESVTGA